LLEGRLAPATLLVNSTADTANATDPYLSLREAIAIVNSPSLPDGLSDQILGQIDGTLHDGGADTIAFDPTGVTRRITLSRTELELTLPADTAAVTIDGGTAGVTVDGNHASRVLEVDPGVSAILAHVAVVNGSIGSTGGGITNAGTLTLTDCTLTSNTAPTGAGIANTGTLTVSSSTLRSNSANAGSTSIEQGGGIRNAGSLTVTDSILGSNYAGSGGGIYNADTGTVGVVGSDFDAGRSVRGAAIENAGGTVTVSQSTFTGNYVTLPQGVGGGIDNSGTMTVDHSSITSNTASIGGGAYNETGGTLTVDSCTLTANTGCALGNADGTLTVTDSTLQGNRAFQFANTLGSGGGIFSTGSTTVIDSTLIGNYASGGGGIYQSAGSLTVVGSTLTANTVISRVLPSKGGGIYNLSSVPVVLRNTIVAGNVNYGTNGGPDINGAVDPASSYNLIGIGDGTVTGIRNGSQGNQVGTVARPIDPLLGPLGDYGGPTQTMPLQAGSPALNAGDPGLAGTPDQRGVVRSSRVNIGAFQASAASLAISAPDTVTAGVPFDFTVWAVDPYGDVDLSYVGSFHLGILPEFPDLADGVFTPADHGLVRFVGIGLYQAGTDTIVAAGDLSGQTNLTVNPGAAAGFVLLSPSNAVSGTPFDVTIIAVDAYGNTATGYTGTIHFTTSDNDPGVVLPPDYTFQPGDAGMVTFSGGVTLITAGDQTITVTDVSSGITGSTVVTL
jgi:hypothetical protein